jgi:methanogenic corrinoid protein MtbC1
MQALQTPSRLDSPRAHGAAGFNLRRAPWPVRAESPVVGIAANDVGALALACLHDPQSAMAVVDDWTRRGVDLETIYLQGIAGACQVFGHWWQEDRVDFASVTLASSTIQSVLYELSPLFLEHANENTNGYSALFVRSPASQHSIGGFILREFFKRSGWSVSDVVLENESQIQRLVQSDWFDVVGYSVCTNVCQELARSLFPHIRRHCANQSVQMMVGGPQASANPGIATEIGADLIGGDARDSHRMALQYVAARGRRR